MPIPHNSEDKTKMERDEGGGGRSGDGGEAAIWVDYQKLIYFGGGVF